MSMKSMIPGAKYPRKNYFRYPKRTWVDKPMSKAPIWASVDLRDGNQALETPMDVETKMAYFDMLVKDVGFKHVEIGMPASSEDDFNFARKLITEGRIPDDVTIVVFTQARTDLVQRTMEAIHGATNVIFHIYIPTSRPFLDIIMKETKEIVAARAVAQVKDIQHFAKEHPETKIQLQFSMEHFSDTEMETACEITNAVISQWAPTPDNKIIVNLPATVEVCPPDVYADMVEYMSDNLVQRENVLISLHTHNDRGTSIAATEFGLRAGADRVEGCLFGQGERTGNVPLEVLAMNMFIDGIDPRIDVSNMPALVAKAEEFTQMKIHDRHPYAGRLVTTSFAGGHQWAIDLGFKAAPNHEKWIVPYLTFDPKDIGRSYEALIQVTAQSGKNGPAFIIEKQYGVDMPKEMRKHFSQIIQNIAKDRKQPLSAEEIWQTFRDTYMSDKGGYKHTGHALDQDHRSISLQADDPSSRPVVIKGEGNGPVSAVFNGFDIDHIDVGFESKSMGDDGAKAHSVAFISFTPKGSGETFYGVGIDVNTTNANIFATINAINSALREGYRLSEGFRNKT